MQEFQVYRWSPDAPEQPKYVSYKVDINACGPMMLDVLLKIKDEQDQSLALRRSCRWALCCAGWWWATRLQQHRSRSSCAAAGAQL